MHERDYYYLNVADSLNECPGKFMANLWQRVYALVKTSIGREADGKFGWLHVNRNSLLVRLNLKWQLLFSFYLLSRPCAYYLFINGQFNSC
jgi:hypothetical protein